MVVSEILSNIYLRIFSSLASVPDGNFFIGNYYFSVRKCVLILKGREIHCTHQDSLLLIAFMKSADRFLSHEEIAEVCSWSLETCGLNERRRTAMSQLRKLFVDRSVEIKSVRNRGGYQLVVIKEKDNLTFISHFSHVLNYQVRLLLLILCRTRVLVIFLSR